MENKKLDKGLGQPREPAASIVVNQPLSFVLELRGQKFRSKREPKDYEELVQAATSLLDNQSIILGCLPVIRSSQK